jgi:hypothetical protein
MGSWNAAAVLSAKAFLTDAVDGEIGVVTFSRNSKKQITFQTQIIKHATRRRDAPRGRC